MAATTPRRLRIRRAVNGAVVSLKPVREFSTVRIIPENYSDEPPSLYRVRSIEKGIAFLEDLVCLMSDARSIPLEDLVVAEEEYILGVLAYYKGVTAKLATLYHREIKKGLPKLPKKKRAIEEDGVAEEVEVYEMDSDNPTYRRRVAEDDDDWPVDRPPGRAHAR